MEHIAEYDKIIIGAGLYGLYSALYAANRGQHVLVLEYDDAPFKRATYINQARVHQGYHYPRSLSTAVKSAGYFEKFSRDYDFCINNSFDQIYAVSHQFSWTDDMQFKAFCSAADIPCEELHAERYFRKGMVDGAFLTREYSYDATLLKDYFLDKLSALDNVQMMFSVRISQICPDGKSYVIRSDKGVFSSGYVLNTTYASANQVQDLAGYDKFQIKYELCEIILCEVTKPLSDIGLTVMDGPFFSIMPFGKTGLHSLTSVTFTPHNSYSGDLPLFACQERSSGFCSPRQLGNCNDCPARPKSAFPYMASLARKYMRDEYDFTYRGSLYSMKPILTSSEIDDSRPTVVRIFNEKPYFISVLSGKINTVYDLDEVLELE